jgi:putative transposase
MKIRPLVPEKNLSDIDLDSSILAQRTKEHSDRKVYKFRLYPNKVTEAKFITILKLCTWLYNEMLMYKTVLWNTEKKKISRYELQTLLKERKKTIWPELKKPPAMTLIHVLKKLDDAFKDFYRRCKLGKAPGYPKKRNVNNYNSFYIRYANGKGFKLDGNKIWLTKIYWVKIKAHHTIEEQLKSVIIKKEGTKWYACIYVIPGKLNKLKKTQQAVGVALRANYFVSTSDEWQKAFPRFNENTKKRLLKLGKRLRRQKKGSRNWMKTKARWENLRHKAENQRRDYFHKISKHLVNYYDLIVFPRFNIHLMIKKRKKSISRFKLFDEDWAQLKYYVKYKTKWYGKYFMEIDKSYLSFECNNCGRRLGLIKSSMMTCAKCKQNVDIYVNVTKNVLREALVQLRNPPLL